MRRIPFHGIRLVKERTVSVPDLESCAHSGDAGAIVTRAIGNHATESLVVLALDGQGRVIGAMVVAHGGMSGVGVRVPDVLRAALLMGAVGFVMGHNHPSGDPTPSADDVTFTAKVATAAIVVGCPMLDHVVVTASGLCRSVGIHPAASAAE